MSGGADPHVYVFHHLPKCGGTSLVQVFEQWFDVWWDYRPPWATGPALEHYRHSPLPLDDLPAGALVCGHFELGGLFLHERYPQVWRDGRYRVMTVLREPLACRLSLIRYELDHGRYGPADVEARLLDRPNLLQRILGADPQRLEASLARYWFVGIAEESEAVLTALAARLGKPLLPLPRANRSRPRELGLRPAAIAEFRQRNRTDLALYARALLRWRRVDAAAAGPGLPRTAHG
jgi:hypothetical protein